MFRKTLKEVLLDVRGAPKEYTDFVSIAEQFGVYDYPISNDWECRLYEKRFDTWVCWDTPVGKSIIFLDGYPVAVSSQAARKSHKDYYWMSLDCFNMVRDFVIDVTKEKLETPDEFIGPDTIIEIEGEAIGDSRSASGYYKRRPDACGG